MTAFGKETGSLTEREKRSGQSAALFRHGIIPPDQLFPIKIRSAVIEGTVIASPITAVYV